MELNKIEEEKIKKELNELENRYKTENTYFTKKGSKHFSNDYPQNGTIQNPGSQVKKSLEFAIEQKEVIIKEKEREREREKEKERENTIGSIPPTPNDKKPETQGIFSPEEAQYLKV